MARQLYPTKSVLEACQNIARDEAKIFSKFDAVKGYHQIPLDEKSKGLTTFITPFGRFRYEKAPLGICSMSEHYERRMNESLENLSNIVNLSIAFTLKTSTVMLVMFGHFCNVVETKEFIFPRKNLCLHKGR